MTDVVVFIPVDKHGQVPDSMQCSSVYFEQTFVCRVYVRLIFKNVKKNKNVYTKCNLKKISHNRF